MNLADLNGTLALVGGVSGAALLAYFGAMVYYARRRTLAEERREDGVRRLEWRLAEIRGLILGRRR